MLDGQAVSLGDSVYVLGQGIGHVTSVNQDGGFKVRIGNNETYYRNGGYIGNQRRVYWQDPFIVIPGKDPEQWQAFVHLARVIYENLGPLNLQAPKEPTDAQVAVD